MKYLLIIMSLAFSFNLQASDYKSEIDQFFKQYKAGKIDKSIDTLYQSNEYISSTSDQIKKLKTQISSLPGLVGELNHISYIDTYKFGDSFVHVTYLLIYDRQPVRFEFQFFKVKNVWKIYSMSFDDDMDDDIAVLARKAALESKNQ